MTHHEVDQQSPDWYGLRLGLPTASRFKDVMAGGAGLSRKKYLNDLADERLSATRKPSFHNHHTRRGTEDEPEARKLYAFVTDSIVHRAGFFRIEDPLCGGSPDGLIGEDGVVEFKSALPHILDEIAYRGAFPKPHICQCQGELLVTGRQWVDIAIYCEGKPLFVRRAQRDERYIHRLRLELERFNRDLDELVAKIEAEALGEAPSLRDQFTASLEDGT